MAEQHAGVRGQAATLGFVLSARDPVALGDFYAQLLGWTANDADPEWVTIALPGREVYLAIAVDENHTPPVWPSVEGQPSQQAHLDVEVTDLDQAVAGALRLGGRLAEVQPNDTCRVLIDPEGHPFCLYA